MAGTAAFGHPSSIGLLTLVTETTDRRGPSDHDLDEYRRASSDPRILRSSGHVSGTVGVGAGVVCYEGPRNLDIHPWRTDGYGGYLDRFSAPQWAHPSWCEGWSVQDTAGHILAAAEQNPLNFYKEMAAARPTRSRDRHAGRDCRPRRGNLSTIRTPTSEPRSSLCRSRGQLQEDEHPDRLQTEDHRSPPSSDRL